MLIEWKELESFGSNNIKRTDLYFILEKVSVILEESELPFHNPEILLAYQMKEEIEKLLSDFAEMESLDALQMYIQEALGHKPIDSLARDRQLAEKWFEELKITMPKAARELTKDFIKFYGELGK